jgi:hypothetical protein
VHARDDLLRPPEHDGEGMPSSDATGETRRARRQTPSYRPIAETTKPRIYRGEPDASPQPSPGGIAAGDDLGLARQTRGAPQVL